MAQFFTLLTEVGQAKLANAIALGQTIEITQLAVGDGGGSLPTPQGDEEQLINEVRRAAINTSHVDEDNPTWIVVEQVIPPDVGGWTIREVGIFDSAGDLIAYGNYPETYKPVLEEGSSRTQTVRFVLEVSDTAAVTLKVDPSVVLATREYVDTQRAEHEQDAEAHSAAQITIVMPIPQAPASETVQQALAALGAFAGEGGQNIAVFDAAGTTNWAVPDVLKNGHRKAHVVVRGAGGAGALNTSVGGGGGGGGGESRGIVDLQGVSSIDITVGAGGIGTTDDGINGAAGGSSSFGVILSATGGAGGAGNGVNTAPPGQGTGGDWHDDLGSGGMCLMNGGGGFIGGTGGGGTHGGTGRRDATRPGGGGSGASASGQRGGHGADGIVIVRW